MERENKKMEKKK